MKIWKLLELTAAPDKRFEGKGKVMKGKVLLVFMK